MLIPAHTLLCVTAVLCGLLSASFGFLFPGDERPTPEAAVTEQPTPQAVVTEQFAQTTCGITQGIMVLLKGAFPYLPLSDSPWMAVLVYNRSSDFDQFGCGGVVVNDRWILTSARCVSEESPVSVRMGYYDITSTLIHEWLLNIEVDETVVHPNFTLNLWRNDTPTAHFINDIALIKLKEQIPFNKNVKPVCLPDGPQAETLTGEALVAGWGIRIDPTQYRGFLHDRSFLSAIKQSAVVNISARGECDAAFDVVGPEIISVNETLQVCVSDPAVFDCEAKHSCSINCIVDTGGPLTTFQRLPDGQFHVTVVGVMSYGSHCGQDGLPLVYTRVDGHVDWIQRTVAEESESVNSTKVYHYRVSLPTSWK